MTRVDWNFTLQEVNSRKHLSLDLNLGLKTAMDYFFILEVEQTKNIMLLFTYKKAKYVPALCRSIRGPKHIFFIF